VCWPLQIRYSTVPEYSETEPESEGQGSRQLAVLLTQLAEYLI
jgi:hypothetical protein